MGARVKQPSILHVDPQAQHMVLLPLVYNVQLHPGYQLDTKPARFIKGIFGVRRQGVMVGYGQKINVILRRQRQRLADGIAAVGQVCVNVKVRKLFHDIPPIRTQT
jgi:hypothetical protein